MLDRVTKLQHALNDYRAGRASIDDVCHQHQQVFPGRGLPRFLTRALPRPVKSREAPKTFTLSEHLQAACRKICEQFTQHDTIHEKLPALLLSILSNSQHLDNAQYLSQFLAIQKTWPFRNPPTSKKNNIDVMTVLMVASQSLEMNRFLFVLFFAGLHRDSHSEFVASVCLWITCLDVDAVAWEVLLGIEFWKWAEEKWVANCKVFHDKWRKHGIMNTTGNLANDASWTQLLYMQTLFGRGGTVVDWTQEFSNKASVPDNILEFTGTAWSARQATDTIREVVKDVMATAFPKAVPKTFDDFMDNSYEWLVSGSSAGIPSVLRHSSMRSLIIHKYGLYPRPTKRSVMEAISREHVLQILQTSPKIVAKAHMKLNETGGKARAIYGVTIWHYIFSNWLMAPIEINLRHVNVDIGLPNADFVRLMLRRSDMAREGAVFSSYDYPDFNAMHSHYHMAIIYEEAKKLAMSNPIIQQMASTDHDIIASTFDWMRHATFRQVVLHPESGKIIQTCGGLYSGNRDTTLINTLLNIAYATVVDRSLRAMRIESRVSMRLCHGDDIISVFASYPVAVAWNEVAGWCRLKGQEDKLLTDESYHEFLRVMGCRDGSLRGCLARCISTFVNGNWETDRMVGLDQKVQELFSNISTMFRRGAPAPVCQVLWYRSFLYFCNKVESLRPRAQMLWETLTIAKDNAKTIKFSSSTYAEKNLPGLISYRSLSKHVSLPYLRSIVRQLPDWIDVNQASINRMMDYLQQGTYGTELPLIFQDNELHPDISELKGLTFEKKSYRSTPRIIDYKSCLEHIQSAAMPTRIRQRIKALYTVLTCLRLREHDLANVLSIMIETDVTLVLQVLQAEGLIRDTTVPDFDAAPELKALNSALSWSHTMADPYLDSDTWYEISYVGSDYLPHLIREIFRY